MAACESEVLEVVSDILKRVAEALEGPEIKSLPYISSHRPPASIGMTSFWGPTVPGIGGEFKSRYTDFVVHELTPDGQVVRLSNNVEVPFASWLAQPKAIASDSGAKEQFSGCFDEKILEQLDVLANEETKESVEFTASDDKAIRTKQHTAIKVLWPKLSSETVTNPDGDRLIRVTKEANRKRSNQQRWPGDQRYCHFTLYKEQMDTSAVLAYLSRCIHIPVKNFHFAGMKDKRGCTTQRVSADRVAAEKIIGAVKAYQNPYSSVMASDFCYLPEPIRLGDLAGNHFQVALRNIINLDDVDRACEAVRDWGFANYFGSQRFGTAKSFSTADIGLLLLQCRWADAVDAILKAALEANRNSSDPRVGEVMTAWFDKRDAEEASRIFPGSNRCAEKKMLQALANNRTDFIGAIRKLPRSLVLMYGHAYQSHIWNRVVARRISQFGHGKVLVGDLVSSEMFPVDCKKVENEDEVYEDNLDCSHGDAKYVSEEDVEKVDVADVILPLPGFDVLLPKNVIGDWYTEMLKADGVKFEECGRQMPELKLSGAYRNMLVKPSFFTWRRESFRCRTDQILVTDRDKVSEGIGKTEPEKGSQHALVLDFQLPACSYASVLVWELSKSANV